MVFITPKSKQLQIHWHHDTNAKKPVCEQYEEEDLIKYKVQAVIGYLLQLQRLI